MNYFKKIKDRYTYSLILLRQMVITDFKLRYQGSVLGYVWSLLRPLFLFIILYVVFAKFLRVGDDVPNYPVYLLTGIVLWNFFAEITNNGVSAIVGRGDLIRKLNFPKYVIILSAAFSALINLCLNLVVIGLFMAITKVDVNWSILLAPLPILEIFIFAIGVSLILGAVFVRLRDINYVWEVVMQAAFYATPIIYPLSLVSDKWPAVANIMLLNPVAQSIQDVRYVAITNESQTIWHLVDSVWVTLIPIVIAIGTFVFAIIFFKRQSPKFAEEV